VTRLFPPDQAAALLARASAALTSKRHLNPPRRHRTYPRVIKRSRHSLYRTKTPADHGIRHDGPPAITLTTPTLTRAMTSTAA
jgi:hypothetical protein